MVKNHAVDDSRFRVRTTSGFILRENPYHIERAEQEVKKLAAWIIGLSAAQVSARPKKVSKEIGKYCCGICAHPGHDRRNCPTRRRA